VGRQGQGGRSRGQSADAHPGLSPVAAPALDELLRALAHEARRDLLRACLHEAQPAGALVERSGLSAPTVSEHLRVLRKTGLLVLERRGRFRYYRTDPALVRAVARALIETAQP
jgi:DNA-binding transcriptional ArsR family regulator